MSVVGLALVVVLTLLAIFAPWVTPYPRHAGPFTDFAHAKLPPGAQQYLFGTDQIGRDILTRIVFGLRSSLLMGVVVLALVVPPGVLLGLLAGYFHGTWIDTIIMRITDIFLAVPPLILALAVASVLKPNLWNGMMAVSLMWWPWYTRLVYGLAVALRNEYFVTAAEVTGARAGHIIFREILPNTISPVFTKMSIDIAWVIIIGSMLSFVGLGVQPPEPSLGTMIADGARYLPDQWWIAVFPALAIVLVVLGFNLLGDGVRDMFGAEES
jgi:peptide/nickel transport system permease protein